MRAIETWLFQTYGSLFMGCSRGTKWVQITLRTLISSLYRLLVSRILSWRRGRLELKFQSQRSKFKVQSHNWKIKHQISKYLNHRFLTFRKSIWGWSRGSKLVGSAWENLKHRFLTWLNSHFGLHKGQNKSSKCFGSTRNIALNSQLGFVKRQKMSSKFGCDNCNHRFIVF